MQEAAKRLRVEEKCREAVDKVEKQAAFYKKRFKQLVRKVIRNTKKGRGRAKRMLGDYSKRHQTRAKNQFKEECQSTLAFLGLYDFIATKIEVLNSDTNQHETFQLVDEGELEFTETEQKELTDGNLDINMWLYLKDKLTFQVRPGMKLS